MKRLWLFVLVALLLAGAMLRDGFDRWIAATDLPPLPAATSAEMRDRSGSLLRAWQVEDGRWRLSPGPVDPLFIEMLVTYEDRRFREHGGIDLRAAARAALQALRHGRAVSGGSTLSMQVARLIEDGTTGRWAGKLRQIRVALALERRLGKDEILQLYLTHAPYGGNLEGVRAASLAWFGKEPRRLTPAQSALLVALPQGPESRRPDRHHDRATRARDRVLMRMGARGLLDPAQVEAARAEPVPGRIRPFPRLAAHLGERLRRTDPGAMRFETTLDAGVQARVEALVARAARAAGPGISAAAVVADHRSGAIIATVGSPGFDERDGRRGFVDMTQALRSPGSTLKPLVYALAFDQGLAHPETLIADTPAAFGRYAPQNFDGLFRGEVRVREALQLSLNIPVVRLLQELGPARMMAALRRSGARPVLPGGRPGLAIALGGLGITLEDLVQLYGALAAGGQGPVLHALQDDGRPEPGRRIVSESAAWQVGNILAGLMPPPEAPRGVLAYKTGTSYGHRDALAVGYDGRHVIGVWMGRADGTPVPGAFGGDLAAPVLFEAFGRLKTRFDPLPPPPPATLIVANAKLPAPLRRFRPREASFSPATGAPEIAFPPDGARLSGTGERVTIKLRGGTAPYTVLANGSPLAAHLRAGEAEIPSPGRGFSTLVVIDANGKSDRVRLKLD